MSNAISQPIPNSMYIEGKNKVEKSQTKDETTVRISCVEVENGYVINKTISGRKTVKNAAADDGKEWFKESVTYISSSNPFNKATDEITIPDVSKVLNMSALLGGKIKV